MASLFSPILTFYDFALKPLPAFAAVGSHISILDVAGALRLALVLRQVRELLVAKHLSTPGAKLIEPRGRVRDFAATLLLVYGGEAFLAPWLGRPPSFLVSPAFPLLYLGAHAFIDTFPTVPTLSLATELPSSILDALTRAILLCDIVPAIVTTHASAEVATSPWALLITATMITNTGMFIANLTNLLGPTPMTLSTPPEFLPAGWTAQDIWAPPLVAALHATLTHSQPFFGTLHALAYEFFAPLGLAHLSFASDSEFGVVVPLDADTARAACVVLMVGLFSTKAILAFGGGELGLGEAPVPALGAEEKQLREKELAARVAGGGTNSASNSPAKKTKAQ